MATSVWSESGVIYLLDEEFKFGEINIKVYCISEYAFVARGHNKVGSLTQILNATGGGLSCAEYKERKDD